MSEQAVAEKPGPRVTMKVLETTVEKLRAIADVEGREPWQVLEDLIQANLIARWNKQLPLIEKKRRMDAEIRRKAQAQAGD